MRNLIEEVLNEDYVSAQKIFENRLDEILEQKLFEMKRIIQAEAFGGLTPAQIQARKELGWKKASDVLIDPRDVPLPSPHKKHVTKTKKKVAVKKKKLKEDLSRAEVEAEKRKLKSQNHPGYQSAQEYQGPREMPKIAGRGEEPAEPKDYVSKKDKLKKSGLKMLKSKNAAKDPISRYEKDIDRAKDLKSRGHKTAVSRVKWSSGGMKARASREVKNYGSMMKRFGSGILSGLGEENS